MVEIPDDVAKQYAAAIRNRQPVEWPDGLSRDGLADLLDPKPPTLRALVSATVDRECDGEWFPAKAADAVLAVVAAWLAAQPLHAHALTIASCADQRGYDVRLLRGEAS